MFWRWMAVMAAQQREHTLSQWVNNCTHTQSSKIVNFMLSIFYHNLKKNYHLCDPTSLWLQWLLFQAHRSQLFLYEFVFRWRFQGGGSPWDLLSFFLGSQKSCWFSICPDLSYTTGMMASNCSAFQSEIFTFAPAIYEHSNFSTFLPFQNLTPFPPQNLWCSSLDLLVNLWVWAQHFNIMYDTSCRYFWESVTFNAIALEL